MSGYLKQTFSTGEGVATPVPAVVATLPYPAGCNGVMITNRYLDLENPQPADATLAVRCTDETDQAVAEYRIRAGDVFVVRYVLGPILLWTLGGTVPYFVSKIQEGNDVADALAELVQRLVPAVRQGGSMVVYDSTAGDFDFAIVASYAYEGDTGLRVDYTAAVPAPATLVVVDQRLEPVPGISATLVNNGTAEGYVQIDVEDEAFEPPRAVDLWLRVYHVPAGGDRTLIVAGKLRVRK
jgi:hypothetical protein